ncbi:SDR family oxidoreductase [Candidatus Woesearchaeota archaeon]|nr:SDR family oxidoreductase [Candidatus Woesearchaeota archaeon]
MIALVTGGNRGIGYEICKQLAEQGHTIILAARDAAKGKEAAEALQNKKLDVVHCALDITDDKSVKECFEFVRNEFGKLDILINNAGIMLDEFTPASEVGADVVRETLETNTIAPLRVAQAFLPLMKSNHYGRIVNVSSGAGQLSAAFSGFPGYRISKAGMNMVTNVLANELEQYNIKVNSCSPGWCRTDMGGKHAPKSAAEGADTIVWLATLHDKGPSGGFFSDRRRIEW